MIGHQTNRQKQRLLLYIYKCLDLNMHQPYEGVLYEFRINFTSLTFNLILGSLNTKHLF